MVCTLMFCTSHKALVFSNTNDEACYLLFDTTSRRENEIPIPVLDLLPDTLTLPPNQSMTYQYMVDGKKWTKNQYTALKEALQETVILEELGDTYSGHLDSPLPISNYKESKAVITVSCPMVILGDDSDMDSILYYPSSVIYNQVNPYNDGFDTIRNRHYSRHLRVMGEPRLFNEKSHDATEVLRFLWLRTFHNPIAIRLELKNGKTTYRLRATQLSGQGGYDPGLIKAASIIDLGKQDSHTIKELITDCVLGELIDIEKVRVKDGSSWVIELVRDGQYKVVQRQSPSTNSCVYQLGAKLLRLSELERFGPVY